jgi:hypothetical protein
MDVPGAELGISSDGFFELEDLPAKTAVIGAGYIAVELAGVLNGLGSDVSLVVRGEMAIRRFDVRSTFSTTQACPPPDRPHFMFPLLRPGLLVCSLWCATPLILR